MPEDAVAGVFRRDLFELLKGLHPGFLRFPGGCIIEGNTLENRYRWKESVGRPESRRNNFNRWAVHDTKQESGFHTCYSHYNQSLGLGYYEYFLLCELIGAQPLPVLNVGLACQYQAFEQAIHEKYPEMRLIGSAGPDITSERYTAAWDFYKEAAPKKENFVYAVDEHYYVKPEWFYEHTDFYDAYPRNIKVFSGEYAAHPVNGMNRPDANTLGGALAEAAFLTGVERNADVVVLASYAPLFARVGYAQWSPDMIWFDDARAYGTPSYYVQKLYGENLGTVTLAMEGQEKALREQEIYANASYDETAGEIIVKVVNHSAQARELSLRLAESYAPAGTVKLSRLAGREEDYNCITNPDVVTLQTAEEPFAGSLTLPAFSFTVARIPVRA